MAGVTGFNAPIEWIRAARKEAEFDRFAFVEAGASKESPAGEAFKSMKVINRSKNMQRVLTLLPLVGIIRL